MNQSANIVDVSVDGRVLRLKNLAKIYCQQTQLTKGHVIDYYQRMAPLIVPHISDRPFCMIHFPHGVGGEQFYQKQRPADAPEWLRSVSIASSRRGSIDWCVVDDTASILFMANRGVLEMHTWFARWPDLRLADMAVIDLDPSNGAGFGHCVTIARALRGLLQHLGVWAVPMTSGGSGLHIRIPILPTPFGEVVSWLTELCSLIVTGLPDIATLERSIARRGDRVYLDAVQNGYGRTIVAPYSVRARPGLPVATPLDWDELESESISPGDFHIANFAQRLAQVGDLMAQWPQRAQKLPDLG